MKNPVKEIAKRMEDPLFEFNGTYAWSGEDGGSLIADLKELEYQGLVKQTMYKDLGVFKYGDYGDDKKYLYVFENDQYKFLCIDSKEVHVSGGGTCNSGTVELYYKEEE